MMDLDAMLKIGLSGVGGAGITAMILRRMWSRDTTELRMDKADRGRISRLEADIETLRRENDELRRQAANDARDVSMQGARELVLKGDVERLRRDYERMRKRAKRMEMMLVERGIKPADEPGDFDTAFMGLDPEKR